jgi:hypothetical protein
MEFTIRSKIKNVQIKYQVFYGKRPAAHSPSYSLTFWCIVHILFKWRGNLTDFYVPLPPIFSEKVMEIFWKSHGISFREKRILNPDLWRHCLRSASAESSHYCEIHWKLVSLYLETEWKGEWEWEIHWKNRNILF